MSAKFKRRDFLTKFGLVATGAALAPKELVSKESNMNSTEPIIKSIRPLGFQWQTLDPFLFCVHHEDDFPKGNKELGPACSLEGRQLGSDFIVKDGFRMYHGERVPGFPGHPHRGFETITVVRKGMVDHSDSMGASGRYGNGDVQWMTAGGGVQHAEMFPLLKEDEKNPLELFQIWLNLPAKHKMVKPHFKMLWSEDIPHLNFKDQNGKNILVEVIAGKFSDEQVPSPPPNSWAFPKENHVAVWNIKLEKGATLKLPKAASGLNRTLYYYKGTGLKINGKTIKDYHAADVKSDAELVLESGATEAKILVLQGKPINEPVVQHGPFVMNTREEIQRAFYDYQQTQFGGWPWGRRDQTHGKTRGRFAQHADGRLEERG